MTKCACGKTGGRFILRGEKWICEDCDKGLVNRDTAKSTFPFTTTHLTGDGKAVTVQSLRHLRQLENRYGAHSAAYSLDGANLQRGR